MKNKTKKVYQLKGLTKLTVKPWKATFACFYALIELFCPFQFNLRPLFFAYRHYQWPVNWPFKWDLIAFKKTKLVDSNGQSNPVIECITSINWLIHHLVDIFGSIESIENAFNQIIITINLYFPFNIWLSVRVKQKSRAILIVNLSNHLV